MQEYNNLPDVETVAELVHNAWWKEKKKQGFHSPAECDSPSRKQFLLLSENEKKKEYGTGFNGNKNKWCEHCHPNMYPYSELTEPEKELDRTTVRSVYKAIQTAAAK